MAPPRGELLIIDDDDDLRAALAELLEATSGRHVLGARDLDELVALGPRALEAALGIIDVNLGPGKPTGMDVLRWLRAHDFRGRVVFLTGHARSNPQVEAAHDAEGVTVLAKPLGIDALMQIVEGTP